MAPSSKEDCMNASVAVAIDRDKNSQFALRWAIDNLTLSDNAVILVHVRVKSHHGSSSSEGSSYHGIPESSKDQHEYDQMQQLFLPFRGFCARKGVVPKEVVLDDTDAARAIADFIDSHYIHNIALGASHRNALTRNFLRKPDVPSVLVKLAPDFCAVYVISKLKATTVRSANRPVPYHGAPPKQPSPMSLPAPDRTDLDDSIKETFNNNTPIIVISPRSSYRKSTGSGLLDLSRFLDCGICRSRTPFSRGPSRRGGLGPPSLERKPPFDNRSIDRPNRTPPTERLRSPFMNRPNNNNNDFQMDNLDRSIHSVASSARYDSNSFSSDDHSSRSFSPRPFDLEFDNSSFSSTYDDPQLMSARDIELEMMRLKQELKQTMEMYSTACKEAILAKKKTRELQVWKTEESRRFEKSKYAEEAALEIAKMEQAKCKAAMEATTMAQRLAEMEAKKRMEAEVKAQREAEEKRRVLRSLAKSDVRYRKYTINEIKKATNNFSDSLKIGEGGYGPVYRAIMDHTAVAIKVLKADAVQGMRQFKQEVEVLSSIRHPNMVLLLGACPENGCLVYEYMDNGSLDDRLFRRGNTPTIPWGIRFQIAAEIATALLFLHQTKPEPLVHRDLKPGNILLDRNYTSKISDVGLARLVPPSVADTVTQYRMTSAAGTFCYIDPEYQQTGMLGIKSDVYSMGIMLLQIITAKPPMGLSHYVGRSIERGTFEQMLDPTVRDWPVKEALTFAKIALQCSELRRKDRPDLGTVVLPELNRLRELGMTDSNSASLFSYIPSWSYTANSRPKSSTTTQGTSKSFCNMGSSFRSSVEESIRAGKKSRSATEVDLLVNRRTITVEDS